MADNNGEKVVWSAPANISGYGITCIGGLNNYPDGTVFEAIVYSNQSPNGETLTYKKDCGGLKRISSEADGTVSEDFSIRMQPNPANDHLTFVNHEATDYKATIVAVDGRVLKEVVLTAFSEHRMDLNLEDGYYFVRFVGLDNKEIKVEKLVVFK